MQKKLYNHNIRQEKNFFAIEVLTIVYAIITSFIVIALWSKLDNPASFLKVRIAVIIGITLIYLTSYLFKFKATTSFIRTILPIALLSYWYPETYEFNKVIPNLDYLFASLEQTIFGFQPALVFAERFSSKWVSEAFYMGYFFYFPMMLFIILYCYFYQRDKFNRLTFIFLSSFLLYYLLFILVPVAGPQFYFPVIGMESAKSGLFLNIDNYFYFNNELFPGPGYSDGIFYRLVKISQGMGEQPTAAFPSSHVGISTILMIWLWDNNKKIMFALFPVYALLCGATVYIQAHYLIDVFAGWLSAFTFYYLFAFSFDKIIVSEKVKLFLIKLSPVR
ncbi:MAG: phosphatase PAP2 family protein [Bacteroidia bacterium]|nr:phosphatase PAP2 family protein [Bacteroidia bacterium]